MAWRHGHTRILMADRGAAFTGGRVRAFCHERGIRRQWSASHAPWSNGAAERQVGNAKSRLARTLWKSTADISLHTLEKILNGGNCEATGFAPTELRWGRRRDGSLMTRAEWTRPQVWQDRDGLLEDRRKGNPSCSGFRTDRRCRKDNGYQLTNLVRSDMLFTRRGRGHTLPLSSRGLGYGYCKRMEHPGG